MTEKLKTLSQITGKNDKIQFIKDNREDNEFLTLLNLRLNPFHSYKIKQELYIPDNEDTSLTLKEFTNHCMKLNEAAINQELRDETAHMLSRAHNYDQEILHGIITKSFTLGVSEVSVNKAMGMKYIPTFDVMLASPMKDNIKFPTIAQLKLDGVRVIAIKEDYNVTLFTRQGRKLYFPLIEKAVRELVGEDDLVLDGELTHSQRTLVSGTCNKNMKSGYQEGSDDFLLYTVFDEMTVEQFATQSCDVVQSERTKSLERRFVGVTPHRIELVKSQIINTPEKLKGISNEYIAAGEEGVIAKDPNALYAFKRSTAWQKLKAINSTTLRVVGVAGGKGKRKGKVGALICESEEGTVKVNVGSGLSDELIDVFTAVPPIDKFIEVHYNVLIENDEGFSLFLPRYVETRIDKTEADTFRKMEGEHIGTIEYKL